jgi:hypothetical protein
VKIPVQEKIAELERRIEALEKYHKWARGYTVTQTSSEAPPAVFGVHWDKMWVEFKEVMRAYWRGSP